MGSPLFRKAVNEIKMRYMYPNELYHYGIRGQKWGIRRFQNPDGTLTAAGRRRYGTVENFERGMTKKQAAEHEAEKQAAINSGKTAQVQKFSSELTKEEMARAVQRIQDEQKLSELRSKDVSIGQQKVKDLTNSIGQIKTTASTVKDAYNVVAQINNAFNKDKKMPIIGEKENDKKNTGPDLNEQIKQFTFERNKEKAAQENTDWRRKIAKENREQAESAEKAKNEASAKAKADKEVEKFTKSLEGKDLTWIQSHAKDFSDVELEIAANRATLLNSIENPTGKKKK